MIWAAYSFFKSFHSLSIYNQPLKFLQLTVNWQKFMIFSFSNDRILWTLDFIPDSVTISVKDLDQNKSISSQEIPPAAWQLLLSQRQDFLSNHLARVPVTPNKQGTHEMRDLVLSSVAAQDLDTSSYQLTDLEDIEFNWERSELEKDAVFRPGIYNLFSRRLFEGYLWRNQLKNPLCRTKKKKRRMLLLHQHPCLSEQRNLPDNREVVFLEQE